VKLKAEDSCGSYNGPYVVELWSTILKNIVRCLILELSCNEPLYVLTIGKICENIIIY